MLASRHHYQHHQQQPPSQGTKRSTWATSLRERLQPRRTAARRPSTSSRLVDATWCPWNGAIYRSINRWHNSWTLLDNPVHLDYLLRSDDETDFNGERETLVPQMTDSALQNRIYTVSQKNNTLDF